jgi:acyl carrier protein
MSKLIEDTAMISIWQDVLQVHRICPASNFFELGGNSLMAMRLMIKVASTFGVKINATTLFQAPTMQEFTAVAEAAMLAAVAKMKIATPPNAISNLDHTTHRHDLCPSWNPVMKSLRTQAKRVAHRLLLNPNVRKFTQKLPFLRDLRGGLGGLLRTHPFDQIYGVDTSGFFPTELLQTKDVTSDLINFYVGSQPSITRGSLSTLPDIKVYTFVDLGCGKGRVVIIGSEFPFQDIVGIELSPKLARIAQSNVIKIHRQFPGRPSIRIIAGNALDNLLTNGKIVFYLYHPFGRELMSQLVHKIESALLSTLEHVFIVYHNPVWGSLLDASPALRRWYAGSIAFDAADLDLSEAEYDSVVIWQSVRGARTGACPEANREIVIVNLLRADLAPLSTQPQEL